MSDRVVQHELPGVRQDIADGLATQRQAVVEAIVAEESEGGEQEQKNEDHGGSDRDGMYG